MAEREKNFEQKKPVQGPPVRHMPKMTGKESKDFKGIVRLLGKDLDGHKPLLNALSNLVGVGAVLSRVLCKIIYREHGVKENTPVGELSDVQLTQVEGVVKNPSNFGVRGFLLNRQKDPGFGVDRHLLGSDLAFAMRQDVDGEKKLRSYRGWRHGSGQKVRGQRNRTTGRQGLTVGVLKKALKQQKTVAASAQEGEKKKES